MHVYCASPNKIAAPLDKYLKYLKRQINICGFLHNSLPYFYTHNGFCLIMSSEVLIFYKQNNGVLIDNLSLCIPNPPERQVNCTSACKNNANFRSKIWQCVPKSTVMSRGATFATLRTAIMFWTTSNVSLKSFALLSMTLKAWSNKKKLKIKSKSWKD